MKKKTMRCANLHHLHFEIANAIDTIAEPARRNRNEMIVDASRKNERTEDDRPMFEEIQKLPVRQSYLKSIPNNKNAYFIKADLRYVNTDSLAGKAEARQGRLHLEDKMKTDYTQQVSISLQFLG
jgi:hypothetical protein